MLSMRDLIAKDMRNIIAKTLEDKWRYLTDIINDHELFFKEDTLSMISKDLDRLYGAYRAFTELDQESYEYQIKTYNFFDLLDYFPKNILQEYLELPEREMYGTNKEIKDEMTEAWGN